MSVSRRCLSHVVCLSRHEVSLLVVFACCAYLLQTHQSALFRLPYKQLVVSRDTTPRLLPYAAVSPPPRCLSIFFFWTLNFFSSNTTPTPAAWGAYPHNYFGVRVRACIINVPPRWDPGVLLFRLCSLSSALLPLLAFLACLSTTPLSLL